MSQIFHRSLNIWSKVSILGGAVFVGLLGFVVVALGVGLFVAGFENRALQQSGAVRALVGMLGG